MILIIALVPSIYFYNQYQKAQKMLKEPELVIKEEAQKLEKIIGLLIELPKGEIPTVATVTDIDEVKNQAFFVRAKNGDKVLIYEKASKAILYRPSTNKIIEVGPVTREEKKAIKSTPTPELSPSPKSPDSQTSVASQSADESQ